MSLVHPATPPAGPSAVRGEGHVITSADELLSTWKKRDESYRDRIAPLTADEIASIRAGREREAGYVEPRRRGPIFVKARAWRPPVLGLVS